MARDSVGASMMVAGLKSIWEMSAYFIASFLRLTTSSVACSRQPNPQAVQRGSSGASNAMSASADRFPTGERSRRIWAWAPS